MRRASFLVEDDGSTPDRPLVACFYCHADVGAEHLPGCVMRRRTVVLRATIEYVHVIAEDWDAEQIDSYYNRGRWCADNIPDDLEAHLGHKLGEDGGCLCGSTKIEYVREASPTDEKFSALKVEDLQD